MLDTLNQIINKGLEHNTVQLCTQDEEINTAQIHIDGKELKNFGSCSYLGLEFHPKIKQGVINGVEKFGSQFSTSRAYLSVTLYRELEEKLFQIFEKPLIATASTTLGHLATLPVIIKENDAVIVDFQVHSSVQMAVQILKSKHIATYVIPHNSMEHLEAKIQSLRGKHKKIWYLADGVYSMYGDCAPLPQLEELLNKYKQFHLYIDDAHGMGWTGKNGAGYVRSQIEHHDKMVLVSSLNKSFASSGGVVVFPNDEMRKDVMNCGGTIIFSGPIQPPMLGAAIASADLHLSPEINEHQANLKEKIDFTNRRLKELGLPQFEEADTPLFFIPCGMTPQILNILKRLKKKGFYANAAGFPAVPVKKGGIRFMVNGHLSLQEIDDMLTTLQQEYVLGLIEEGSSLAEVAKVFKLPPINIQLKEKDPSITKKPDTKKLTTEMFDTVASFREEEWDNHFKGKGSSLHSNLLQLEKLFRNNTRPENNWKFYYNRITDENEKVVLIGYYTCALLKDDMLANSTVTDRVREKRRDNPYFLTSKTIISGSMFTKGEAVLVDFQHPLHREAISTFTKQMQNTAEKENASKVILRDFNGHADQGLRDYMLELGLSEQKLPNNCVVENMNWESVDDLLASLGQKYRYSLRKEILKFSDRFQVCTSKPETEEEIEYCYKLYRSVSEKASEISVFDLPYKLFKMMCTNANYDIIRLYLKDKPNQPVAVMFSFLNHGVYNALLVGLDYEHLWQHNIYKQILFQSVLRAKELNCNSVDLAYTAELEKKKVGASVQPAYAYVMALEHYSFAVLEAVS